MYLITIYRRTIIFAVRNMENYDEVEQNVEQLENELEEVEEELEKKEEGFLECERWRCFLLLITVGGFFGAYTFSVKGGVFCNAQTANIVLFGMALYLNISLTPYCILKVTNR